MKKKQGLSFQDRISEKIWSKKNALANDNSLKYKEVKSITQKYTDLPTTVIVIHLVTISPNMRKRTLFCFPRYPQSLVIADNQYI